MLYSKIEPKAGEGIVNVVIEIPNGSTVKYEFDSKTESMVVDRFSMTTMGYPCNYGLIPNTLGGDEDPIDVLMITRVPLISGVVIKGRVIGVLNMSDEAGEDAKIICVPTSKCDKFYDKIQSYKDLDRFEIEKIEHFFEHYKDLEEGKFVKIRGWGDVEEANQIIEDSIIRFCEDEEEQNERQI